VSTKKDNTLLFDALTGQIDGYFTSILSSKSPNEMRAF